MLNRHLLDECPFKREDKKKRRGDARMGEYVRGKEEEMSSPGEGDAGRQRVWETGRRGNEEERRRGDGKRERRGDNKTTIEKHRSEAALPSWKILNMEHTLHEKKSVLHWSCVNGHIKQPGVYGQGRKQLIGCANAVGCSV